MSNRYIVRQPIRNAEDEIIGYEMVYHGGSQAYSTDGDAQREYAAADAVSSLLSKSSVKSLNGVTNFMTFNTALLMKRVAQLFEPSNLVIQIDDSVVINPLSMHFVQMLAKQGYKIAVNEFEFSSRYMSLMDCIDYIRVDVRPMSEAAFKNIIDVARGMNKKCIATHIESHKKYAMALSLNADGYEGPYVTTREKLQPRNRRFLKSAFFKVLCEIIRDVPDITRVETIIASDPMLSYDLLKLVNSQYFALRNRPTTVHQALTAVGFGQLKQWVYMLCVNPSEPDANEGLNEFLQLSFMRGYFYRELMRFADNVPLSITEGYLMGMFSTLTHLIDVSVDDLLQQLELPAIFSRTLDYKQGSSSEIYRLILSYELADWEAVEAYAEKLGISSHDVSRAYFNCIKEVGSMWSKLNTPFVQETI